MTVFNRQRLDNTVFKLDIERMRRGWYSDKYFENVHRMLSALAASGYRYDGRYPRDIGMDISDLDVGNMVVEMQIFTRRKGRTVVVGMDKAVTMLRHCTGYWEGDTFVETHDQLEVWAVHDGAVVHYPPRGNAGDGDPRFVQPVMKIRGRYRDFALLETPILGALGRGSRIATNVYETLVAAQGKPVLFFPARFDAHEVQAADGYAYDIAVQRFNHDYGQHTPSLVSTDAQGDYWGSTGIGTVPHAVIACFLGDIAAAMVAFAFTLPPEVSRIALVDFNNDSVTDSLRTLRAMFDRYRELVDAGKEEEARKYVLYGVRLDTSRSIRDVAVPPLGDPELDLGVNPRLVFIVREALDRAWERWGLPPEWEKRAKEYCRNVRIVVSGGFNPERIRRFERLGVPADSYGVGSSLMSNDAVVGTNTDFTADVVRIQVKGKWIDMAKVGRAPCDNPDLERVMWE
ncbi:MAG TPA: nicotinate phosphoribosyltransferase [Anaerolineae bacterium]|nr:nicotinate phosphoribosyltransferase [Anaerolineae bacterium]